MKSFIWRFWQRHEYLSIGLMWAAIIVVLFWEPLTSGSDRVIGGNDITYAYLPWLRYFVESVRNGIFPLWNPYVFAGAPFAANPQTTLFHPATWPALWVGPERAFGLSIALHTWIAALGMYGWLRAIGATRVGAFFASIAYALSGFMSARIWAGHYGPVLGAAWLPVVLWGVTHALRRRSIAWAVTAGLPFGMLILTGHTHTIVLLTLGAGAVVVFEAIRIAWPTRDVRTALTMLGLFGLTIFVGAALASIQLLPMLTFVQNSARATSRSLDFASRFSLPPGHLLTMLIPDFFGEPVTTGYWSVPGFEEYIYYVGVPTLILAALSIFTRDARARFFVALGALGLVAALGPDGVVYRFMPFFDLFRAPARSGMWAVFSFAAAAGLCVSALQTSGIDAARRVLAKWPRVVIVAGISVGLIVAGFAYALFAGFASVPESARLYHLANDAVAFVVLFGATSALLKAWSARPDRNGIWAFSLAALLLIDLGAYHDRLVRMAPSTRGAAYAAADRVLDDRLKDNRFIRVNVDIFQLNGGMDFGQSNVYGYDSLVVARLQTLLDRAGDLTSSVFDLLNVRYVISGPPIAEALEPVGELDGFTFYERPNAAPRAWIVHVIEPVPDDNATLDRVSAADFDPQAIAVVVEGALCEVSPQIGADSVSITRYEPNRIEAQVDTGAAGLLVFSEIDFPGWIATVDGAPAEIHRIDYALRGMCLPGGSHTVTMVYDPGELKLGAVVSLSALGLVGAAGVVLAKRRWSTEK